MMASAAAVSACGGPTSAVDRRRTHRRTRLTRTAVRSGMEQADYDALKAKLWKFMVRLEIDPQLLSR